MASRAITDCTPELADKIKKFTIAMFNMGIPFIITCTARAVDEQVALYAQGRKPLAEVNRLRVAAGLPILKSAAQNKKVTWTLQSKHLIDLDDGNPQNDKSRAFDIAIMDGKKASWDIKVDVNRDRLRDYEQAGIIGESVGLRWGGRFKSPDMPHFEDV